MFLVYYVTLELEFRVRVDKQMVRTSGQNNWSTSSSNTYPWTTTYFMVFTLTLVLPRGVTVTPSLHFSPDSTKTQKYYKKLLLNSKFILCAHFAPTFMNVGCLITNFQGEGHSDPSPVGKNTFVGQGLISIF